MGGKSRATLRREAHAAQEVLKAGVGAPGLLQPCVFRLGFLQDGDVGVGVLPDVEELLVGLPRYDYIPGKGASAAEAKVREREQNGIFGIFGKKHQVPVGKDVVELQRGSFALAKAEQSPGPHDADPRVERNWRGR